MIVTTTIEASENISLSPKITNYLKIFINLQPQMSQLEI